LGQLNHGLALPSVARASPIEPTNVGKGGCAMDIERSFIWSGRTFITSIGQRPGQAPGADASGIG
jgi:hypothetical protein